MFTLFNRYKSIMIAQRSVTFCWDAQATVSIVIYPLPSLFWLNEEVPSLPTLSFITIYNAWYVYGILFKLFEKCSRVIRSNLNRKIHLIKLVMSSKEVLTLEMIYCRRCSQRIQTDQVNCQENSQILFSSQVISLILCYFKVSGTLQYQTMTFSF